MSQVYTETQTRYITAISAVDANTDQITISTQQPGGMPGPGMPYSFPVAKPHSYTTGEEFQYVVTVNTP